MFNTIKLKSTLLNYVSSQNQTNKLKRTEYLSTISTKILLEVYKLMYLRNIFSHNFML